MKVRKDLPPNRLEHWRLEKKLTRKQLEQLTGVSASTIERVENRKMNLTHKYLGLFAHHLGVAESEILDIVEEQNNQKIKFIPIVDWEDTGREIGMAQLAAREAIPMSTERNGLLATRVVGNAMSRIVRPGVTIIYDPTDKALVDTKRYLIRLNGEVSLREYRDTAGPARFEADSIEGGYDTIFESIAPIPVIGRVLHFIGDM